MLLWFADLMNVTEEVTIHRPDVSTLLSSAFIRGDLNALTRGPFIRSVNDDIGLGIYIGYVQGLDMELFFSLSNGYFRHKFAN